MPTSDLLIEERFMYFCKMFSINLLQLIANGANGELECVPRNAVVA